MISYEVYDPATGRDVELLKAHEITAHTAAKIPGFSGVVSLSSDSYVRLRVERGIVMSAWNENRGVPLAIYEPCRWGGLDRVYLIKLSTLVRSSRYSFH